MTEKLFKTDYLNDKRLPLHLIKRDPQDVFEMHSHDFSELVIVYRGRGKHRIYGEYRTIEAGDIFLIGEQTMHGYSDLEDLALYNILFDMRELNNPLQAYSRYPAVSTLLQLKPEPHSGKLLRLTESELLDVLGIIRSIEAEQAQAKEHFQLSMAAQFVLLTVTLARCYSAHKLSGEARFSSTVSDLISRLSEHSEKHWSRREMARLANVSESTLTRMFKARTGYAPNEYLIILRVKKGAALLLNTDLSIGEIAGRIGFYDSNYFCRQFKKYFGTSPNKYRSLSS